MLCQCVAQCGRSRGVKVIVVLQVEERLSSYMDAFDIVLVSDQSMTVPNAVLRQILYAAETSVATSNCDAMATHPCDSDRLQPQLDA